MVRSAEKWNTTGLAHDARAFVYQSDALAWAEEARLAVLPAVQL
jgi:hypothetical protein